MANILDYLDWRGDLTLTQDSFNEVDNLILCQLVYMTFDRIMTQEHYNEQISLSEAAKSILRDFDETEKIANNLMPDTKLDRQFLAALSDSRRFGSMRLTRYVNRIDYKAQTQFCAITILTSKDSAYIAFRGTDDSLVGWKENFNMSFLTPVPAQQAAVDYLEEAADSLLSESTQECPFVIRVGGHSKGGNLAVYAAAFCNPAIQNQIQDVYSNDGPGFDSGVINQEGYQTILEKVHTLVPQTSVVGMLLEHEESYAVIHSNGVGLMQHAPYSWNVLGKSFVHLKHVDAKSQRIDYTLRNWINGLDYEQREIFVDGLYRVLSSAELKNTSDFSGEGLKPVAAILKSMSKLDDGTKKVISQTISALWNCARESLKLLPYGRNE